MCKEVIIIGAGGHAKVICDIVLKSGDKVIGFLDDCKRIGEEVLGIPVLGTSADISKYKEYQVIIGIGNADVREKIAKMCDGVRFYTAIHPTAVIGSDVVIGEGSAIMANACINPGTKIGRHCIINTLSVVEHDNKLSDYVHISPAAALAGGVLVGEKTHIGIGAKVKNNIEICADVIVGAGGVVVKSINEPGIYVGVPVRKVR